MASVWKRLQRVNKRAAKFEYTASYHRVDLDTSPKWKPNKLSIVWTRRSRRVITDPVQWEPSLKDPLKGSVMFAVPENRSVAVTLFKDARTNELEDKDWTFVLEDVSPTGKRRRLAVCAINMRKYASLEPSQRALVLTLEPTTQKIQSASLHLTLHCVLLREGQATDEDMQSLASLLSVNNNSDIAVLEDLDEDDYTLSDNSTRQMSDLRQQMEEMTQSLTNSDIAATPNSIQSLRFDATPTAPHTPLSPLNDQTPTNDLKIVETLKKPEFLPKNLKIEPKMTSTPKPTTPQESFKSVVFKPKMVSRLNLKPLDLKSNFNSIGLDRNDNEKDDEKTPTAEEKVGRLDKDKTPVQDLLEWCQMVTGEYKQCRVTNLTTSFRSGLAFCAIIHRFRPDLIDFSGLQPDESEQNLRVALEASATLGISQVLTAADVCKSKPDRLAIMTYLFQLRAHFTGNELQVEQLGNDETESSYLVGRHDTDGSLPRDLFSREISTRRSKNMENRPRPGSQVSQDSQVSVPSRHSQERYTPDKPPIQPITSPAQRTRLMTRKELTDPFGSDDEESPTAPAPVPVTAPNTTTLSINTFTRLVDEPPEKPKIETATTDPLQITEQSETEAPLVKETTPELPKPTPQLLSRHDELKERARQLLEATKREARAKEKKRQELKEKDEKELNGIRNGDLSPTKPMTEEERQQMLRERARKLIANARAGIVSPTSPTGCVRSPRGTVEIISKQSVMDEIAADLLKFNGNGTVGGVEQLEAMLSQSSHSSPGSRKSASPDRSEGSVGSRGRSPLPLAALLDNANAEEGRETGSYIQSELEALEKEQSAIDERAAALEKQLRCVMQSADNTEEEDRLMSQWFNLVNKKNALLRRQMQLNILEQEEDLSRRCELLARELRLSLGVEEWRKTDGQKRRERLLLQELLAAVNERDRLVQEMDEQEKAIANDDEIERNLSQVEIQRKNNCILQ
ncbi:EH domain-binding protein 1 isoform X2 [Leguminivora glycinivorella]|nr:EH domain-binding protein 1 isoform X2 [Leguminivora glycinivorella]